MPKEAPRERIPMHKVTPEEEPVLRQRIVDAAASGPAPSFKSMHDLTVEVVACSIVGDEIRCSVTVSGTVIRPDAEAVVTGRTIPLVVPAKVTRDEE